MQVLSFSARARRADEECACTVSAHTTLRVPLESIGALRDNPGLDSSPSLPPRFLRHSDEQTVVGVAAVLRAMAEPQLAGTDFSEWGVLAAPRLLGRLNAASMLSKFMELGPPAISPHAIPQHSLHAVSSAVSVALGMRGPNFGIGGGPECLAEGLLVALTFLRAAQAPGMWLVLTEWDTDPIPDGNGGSATPAVCCASALALIADAGSGTRLRLRPTPARQSRLGLIDWLSNPALMTATGHWTLPLSWGGHIELVVGEVLQQRKAA